ncbi:MAG: hypothetical protein R3E94_07245 [Burkholderiaceae bacterium]
MGEPFTGWLPCAWSSVVIWDIILANLTVARLVLGRRTACIRPGSRFPWRLATPM